MNPEADPVDDGAPDLRTAVDRLLAGPRPLPIVQAGHPVLRAVAAPYDGSLDAHLLDGLVEAMRLTMHAAPGVGLAAPQVGLGVAIAVLEDTWPADADAARVRERSRLPFRVLVNPRYEPVGPERVSFYEGCLSVAGWSAVTPRWRTVRLTATDERGRAVDEVLTGWPARIVQHEVDHLGGTLYLDGAHLRSLSGVEEAGRWLNDPTPERAAGILGFPWP